MEDSAGSREMKEMPEFFEIISKASSKGVPGADKSLIFRTCLFDTSSSGLESRYCFQEFFK
jgi:hypothetical protein